MQVLIDCLETCHVGFAPCAGENGLRTGVRIARIARIASFA